MRDPNEQPYIPPDGPPRISPPSPEIYERMGAEGIYAMLEAFYERLGDSDIAWMFPKDLAAASRKSAAFFIGLCGGPPLYHQTYGPPRMRARHLPFPIDAAARQIWLDCFQEVLKEAPEAYGFPEHCLPGFVAFLEAFSGWMVNTR